LPVPSWANAAGMAIDRTKAEARTLRSMRDLLVGGCPPIFATPDITAFCPAHYKSVSQRPPSPHESDELLQRHAFGPQAVFRLGSILVAEGHSAHHHLRVGNAEDGPDKAVIRRERRLRAGVQSARPRGDHDRLEEHAMVDPRSLVEITINGEDHADRG